MCYRRCVRLLLPALLVVLLPPGCGHQGSELVPVSGRVMLDNKPLARATVHFMPASQPGGTASPDSYAVADADGRFTLRTSVKGNDRDGAVAGKHRVEISIVEHTVGSKTRNGEQLPYKYNHNSKLEFTVPPDGTSEANFLNLTSK
jgi:hypothetical protein